VLTLRLKQAETALAGGQLDEAFELLQDAEVAGHRRGQKLIARLVGLLTERGGAHLAAGRTAQAMADCDKAGRLGGNRPEIAELREAVIQAMSSRRRSSRRRQEVLQAAQRQIEDGRLSVGERLLDGAGPGAGSAIRQDVAARRQIAESALSKAAKAADRGDWIAAFGELLTARRHAPADAGVADLTARTTKALAKNVRSAIEDGRLDKARFWLDYLARLDGAGIETVELRRFMDECARALACIADGRHEQAGQILRRTGAILRAKWLDRAAQVCRDVAAGVSELHAGPLGLLATAGPADVAVPEAEATQALPAAPIEPGEPPELPQRFVILVDGVGSFLVHRGSRVTFGPISSSRRPDVGLMGEAAMPVAEIVRTDEDYFLRADPPAGVNDRPAANELLRDGDRIALSARCRMKFLRPNAASTSAVIALTGARMGRKDIRHVVLMDRELVIGPAGTAHIRGHGLSRQVVLYVRDNRLHCRSAAPVTAGGRPLSAAGAIPMDTPVRAGDVSFVVGVGGTGL